MNVLEMFSERYHFNEASTTKSKIKSPLCSFWNEKSNVTNATNSAKRRAMQAKKILKDSLVQDAYDEMLEAGTSHNENNSNGEEQQPEPKKRKYLKPTDFKDVGWGGDKVTILNEHLLDTNINNSQTIKNRG
ncbi:hypothetical protein CLU79DRAFT_81141 [Phycomyces nitens]|nr:hypothetical protein CLU79DRAFT_81141 [Phycomyces nitens]